LIEEEEEEEEEERQRLELRTACPRLKGPSSASAQKQPPRKKKAYLGGNHQSRSINSLRGNLNFEVRLIDKWIILGRG
jgi:hypothetical protein